MIPDYVYFTAQQRGLGDVEAEKAWANFEYLKLHFLKEHAYKIFFLNVLLLFDTGMAVRIMEFLQNKLRVQKVYDVTLFKHEHLIHYLNSMHINQATLNLIWALINCANDLQKVKIIVNETVKQCKNTLSKEYVRRKLIKFL